MTNPENFSNRLVLPFTPRFVNPERKRTGFIVCPEILSPESRVNICIQVNVLGLTDEW